MRGSSTIFAAKFGSALRFLLFLCMTTTCISFLQNAPLLHSHVQSTSGSTTIGDSLSVTSSERVDVDETVTVEEDRFPWLGPSEIENDNQAINLLGRPRSDVWKDPCLTTKSFNYLLLRFVKSAIRQKGETAARIIRYMTEQSMTRPEVMPDTLTLNAVLSAFSKGKELPSRSSITLADEIFAEWKEGLRHGAVNGALDLISYNTLIQAHARSGNMDRAQCVFQELKDSSIKADAISFGTLMRGYALRGDVANVLALFQEMEQSDYVSPTPDCCNQILHAYVHADMPNKAEYFLKSWVDGSAGLPGRPDIRSYNMVVHAYSRIGATTSIKKARTLFDKMPKRDGISYTTMMNAYCTDLSGRIAIDACEELIETCLKDKDVQIDSNIISNFLYSTALIEHKEMPSFAESVVAKLSQNGFEPDTKVYNALLFCWSKSGDYEAARRARQTLSMMEKKSSLKPDIKTYTTVLDTFARSREKISLEFAKNITQRMERNGPKPNAAVYTSLIQNFARSDLPYKAVEAAKVLQRMKESASPLAQPNIISYNSVLNAAEHSDPTGGIPTEEALKVACLTFDEIRTSPVNANHITYGTFLGVLGKLMPAASRQEIVGLVFRRAKQEGQVSPLVLRKLQQAAVSQEHFRYLIEGNDEGMIPDAWTSNVAEIKARHME